MFNLIKSELYRFRHNRNAILLLMVGIIGIVIFIPLNDAVSVGDYVNSYFEVSVIGYMVFFYSGKIGLASILLPIFLTFFTGYYEDKGYKNGINNYSIMCGYARRKILFSKILAEGLSISIFVVVSIGAIMFFLWGRNGITDMLYREEEPFIEMLPLKFLLLFISSMHIVAVVILCSRLFKSGVKAALFSLVWFFEKGYAGSVIRFGFGRRFGVILEYGEPFMVYANIFPGPEMQYTLLILMAVISSMLVEIILLYIIISAMEKRTGCFMSSNSKK